MVVLISWIIQCLIGFAQTYYLKFIIKSSRSLSNHHVSNVFFLLWIILIYIRSLSSMLIIK